MIEKEIKRLYRLCITSAIICMMAFVSHLYIQYIHDNYRETMSLSEEFYCVIVFVVSFFVIIFSSMTMVGTICSAGVLERIQRDTDGDSSCISS